jgi:hypothetical protein
VLFFFFCSFHLLLFSSSSLPGVPLFFGPEDTSLMRKKLTLEILNSRAESAEGMVDVD